MASGAISGAFGLTIFARDVGAPFAIALVVAELDFQTWRDLCAPDVLGDARPIVRCLEMIRRVAPSDSSVLLTGETGTGKELFARAVHRASGRHARPFVAVNCAAIPENLIETELFGHLRGAFTGAAAPRAGKFAAAHGGTLFLDEVGDLPLSAQAKLLPVQVRFLRALQEREVRAVGGDGTRAVDVRVVAATNVDLDRAVNEGRFRKDLFFRLNVVSVNVPPLRDRREDIPALVARLMQRHGGEHLVLSPEALEALLAYDWPGNIRELENAIQHAIALSRGDRIEVQALPPKVLESSRFSAHMGFALSSGGSSGSMPALHSASGSDPNLTTVDDGVSLTDAKRKAALDFEKAYIERVLEIAKGLIAAAARIAGIDRTNFRRLMQRHGIDPNRFKG